MTLLPGIGVRKDFALASGRRIGVITRKDGVNELIVSRKDDPDATQESITLSNEEAAALGNLLGSPQLIAQLGEEHRDLPGINTRRLPIRADSRFVSRTLGDTAMRTKTGVSVVAVMRAGQVQPSPTPDFTLAAGDLLVAVGTADGLDAAAKLLGNA
ncbi:Potassium channel TrkA, KefG [Rhodococcus sp. B7740]|nr:Potassium channel TrkA, KefG [Rhodococcus sp. B7740]